MKTERQAWRRLLATGIFAVSFLSACGPISSKDNDSNLDSTLNPQPTSSPSPTQSDIIYHAESDTVNTYVTGHNTGDFANFFAENHLSAEDLQSRLSCKLEIEQLNPYSLTPVANAAGIVEKNDVASLVHYKVDGQCVPFKPTPTATRLSQVVDIIRTTATQEAFLTQIAPTSTPEPEAAIAQPNSRDRAINISLAWLRVTAPLSIAVTIFKGIYGKYTKVHRKYSVADVYEHLLKQEVKGKALVEPVLVAQLRQRASDIARHENDAISNAEFFEGFREAIKDFAVGLIISPIEVVAGVIKGAKLVVGV